MMGALPGVSKRRICRVLGLALLGTSAPLQNHRAPFLDELITARTRELIRANPMTFGCRKGSTIPQPQGKGRLPTQLIQLRQGPARDPAMDLLVQ